MVEIFVLGWREFDDDVADIQFLQSVAAASTVKSLVLEAGDSWWSGIILTLRNLAKYVSTGELKFASDFTLSFSADVLKILSKEKQEKKELSLDYFKTIERNGLRVIVKETKEDFLAAFEALVSSNN